MIVYSVTKQQFVNDVRSNAIADIIENEVSRKLNRNSPKNESDASEWVQLPEHINTTQGMFVTRVVGESMNKRIINGSWCLFKANPGGSRNGKIVLVQHRDIEDPDHGGTYTVKTYHSEKIEEDGVLVNQCIVL